MNILVLGLGFKESDTTYEMDRLTHGLKAAGHSVYSALWSDVLFLFQNKETTITIEEKDVADFDYIICRYPLTTTTEVPTREMMVSDMLVRMYRHFMVLVDYARQHNIRVLNEDIVDTIRSYDKMTQHYILAKHNIPTLTSFLYTGYNPIEYGLKMPVVAKTIEGSRGVEVFLINTEQELQDVFQKYGAGNVLVQEYVHPRNDYRVLTLGDTIIGSVLCTNDSDDFRTNMMIGGAREAIKTPPEMERMALSAKNAVRAEFTGIDIIEYRDEYFVLEVNVFPMFMGFENATNIDVVKRLTEYIASA